MLLSHCVCQCRSSLLHIRNSRHTHIQICSSLHTTNDASTKISFHTYNWNAVNSVAMNQIPNIHFHTECQKLFVNVYMSVVAGMEFSTRSIFAVIFHFWKLNLEINAVVSIISYLGSKHLATWLHGRGKKLPSTVVSTQQWLSGGLKCELAFVVLEN